MYYLCLLLCCFVVGGALLPYYSPSTIPSFYVESMSTTGVRTNRPKDGLIVQDNNDEQSHQGRTIYLCRHAETEENIRMHKLQNVLNRAKRFRLPSDRRDFYLGCQFIGMSIAGKTDSVLSEKGKQQVGLLRRYNG